MMETFEQWWEREGQRMNPDEAKRLAKCAYNAALEQSRNYVADEEVMPEKVTFANGRVVYIADNKTPGVQFGVYLGVAQLPE